MTDKSLFIPQDAAGKAEAATGRALPQGRQLAGVLQHQAGLRSHAADQGEGRQEEVGGNLAHFHILTFKFSYCVH